jgi:hypothetical protein
MSLINYGDAEIQQDLDKLLIQVQKELKKKMFFRRHIKLLWNDVSIELGELDINVLGEYETIENKAHKHKFTHKIIISTVSYNEYKNGLYGLGIAKRYTRKRIKNTIAHELIHAYVYEKYEWCGDEYKFHCDGSPIFLSILVFLNISSGHKSMRGFEHSETYKKVKSYDSFEMLEAYLIHTACEYEKVFRELEELFEGGNVYGNIFRFSAGDISGVKGIVTNTFMINGFIGKTNMFTVGANTDINKLKDLVLAKINGNIFDKKLLIMDCKNVEDKRNKLKLQSMNA